MNKIVFFLSLLLLAACNGERPEHLGVFQDGVYPCPLKKKCVSSTQNAEDKDHFIHAMAVEGDYSLAFQKIQKIAAKKAEFKLQTLHPNFLQFEHTSGMFSIIHDVEFFYSQAQNVIHIRAQSRGKIPDFGKSRAILEEIKFKYFQNDVN